MGPRRAVVNFDVQEVTGPPKRSEMVRAPSFYLNAPGPKERSMRVVSPWHQQVEVAKQPEGRIWVPGGDLRAFQEQDRTVHDAPNPAKERRGGKRDHRGAALSFQKVGRHGSARQWPALGRPKMKSMRPYPCGIRRLVHDAVDCSPETQRAVAAIISRRRRSVRKAATSASAVSRVTSNRIINSATASASDPPSASTNQITAPLALSPR